MQHIKHFFFSLILTSITICVAAQTNKTDSLQNVLNSTSSDVEKIKAYKKLSEIYEIKNFDRSIAYATEGVALALTAKDISSAATLKSQVGLAFYFKGNYDSAANYYSAALDLVNTANDPPAKASILNLAGRLYRKLKDYDKAIAMYDEAFAIYKKLNDENGMATIYNESGVVFEYKKDFDEAINRYTKSLQLREKLNDPLGKSYSLSFIGAIYAQQKKYADAEKYLNDALQIRRALKDTFATAFSIVDLAAMYTEKKDLLKAIIYYDSANAILSSLKYPQILSESYLQLSKIYEQQGNTAKSLSYFKQYAALKDSLLSTEKISQIEELNTKYETEKKEQQLKLQQATIQKKDTILIGAAVAFILIILTATNIYKKRQAQNNLLLQQEVMRQQDIATKAVIEAEENERKRIAADLHDGVGQMMSAAKMNLSVFESELPFSSEAQKLSFENVINLVDESCKEIRIVSHQMMPNALLKSGLASAIKEFIDKIDSKIIKVTLHAEGLNEAIDKNIETVLYRVVQECVNNVLKHSKASHLDISLINDADGIAVTIEDNGVGFDSSDKNKFEGIGVKNIISRITYLKGTIDFDSTPGKGTLIAIHVPVSKIIVG